VVDNQNEDEWKIGFFTARFQADERIAAI